MGAIYKVMVLITILTICYMVSNDTNTIEFAKRAAIWILAILVTVLDELVGEGEEGEKIK